MKKQLKDENRSFQIVKTAIVGLLLSMLIGCQQINQVANSNASTDQANSSANSNTDELKTLKNNLVGTWISTTEDNKTKLVFTENELTQYSGDKIEGTGKYKFVDGQTIEFTDEKTGETSREKASLEGDELTVVFDGTSTKFKRESSTAEANNSTNEKSEKIKEIETKILGTWLIQRWGKIRMGEGMSLKYVDGWKEPEGLYVFGKNEFWHENTRQNSGAYRVVEWRGPYRIIDAENLLWLQNGEIKETRKISFENNNTIILSGLDVNQPQVKLVRQSNNYAFVSFNNDTFDDLLFGSWIADDERIVATTQVIRRYKNDGTSEQISIGGGLADGKGFKIYGTEETLTTDGEVLTITDNNGVEKKFKRLTTID